MMMRRFAAVAAVAVLLPALALPRAAVAAHEVQPARIAGETRYGTAARIAVADHAQGTEFVLLARGDAFPDALAAAAVAGALDAPVLLTAVDEVPSVTREALSTLAPRVVVLLGGEGAISAEVEEDLRDSYEVRRIPGADRFATAANAAQVVEDEASVGSVDGRRTAFVVNAFTFADALAAGAPAFHGLLPILLTARDEVPPATTAALDRLGIGQVIVVGGEGVVSRAAADELGRQGRVVRRIAGPARTATAAAVADFALTSLGFDGDDVVLARGDDFADALAAGPHAGALRAPVLLAASPDELGDAAREWLRSACPDVAVVQAVGGTRAVSPATLDAATTAAADCPHGERGYLVAPQEPLLRDEGEVADFSVVPTSALADQPVDLALVPCVMADVVGRGPDHFEDADDDRHADAVGSTDTFNAAIAVLNGEDIEDTRYVRNAQVEDGDVDVRLYSGAPDCTVLLAFDDTDEDGRFDLDAGGHPAEPYGVGQVAWTRGGQTYIVAPQEVQRVDAGQTVEFEIGARYDEREFTGPVDVALFPCANSNVPDAPVTFADEDADGSADGLGTTDTGSAAVATVNGEDIADTRVVRSAEPGPDGVLRFRLFSGDADCTVVAVFDDRDDDGALDVRETRPVEPFGAAKAHWSQR